MKSILKLHSAALLITGLALSNSVGATEGPLVEKKKTYSKTYTVSGNDKITLDNRFGELKISTWDKNEVKVDVTITAEAGTDERAQAILDAISIEDGKSGNGVYFKTKIDNRDNDKKDERWQKGEKQRFNIDYNVYMPARNPLHASNEFGATTIGDFSGEATLNSKFGSLTAGKITNAKKINVEFGQATIASVNNGDLNIKFSKANIGNLNGTVNANFEHCGGIKLDVNNDIKGLYIRNEFTTLYLDVNVNLNANFEINTHFAELNNKSNFNIKKEGGDDDRRGPVFDHRYSGKSGSGDTRVQVKSNFGQVTVGHNLPDEVVNDKEKNKNKNKDKKRTTAI
jgi:hypothetical protein